MLVSLPLVVQDLGMGSPPAVATGVNFLKQDFTISGVSTPVVAAYSAASAASVAVLSSGTILDKLTADLSSAGYARNGAFFLALTASTPVTVDLTSTSAAAPAAAGDTYFKVANEVIFNNTGSTDVIVSPGASRGFNGPLSGTLPTFTVPAGGKVRWHNPAGWAVTAIAKNLKFDPGATAAQIGVSVGGS